MVERAKRMENVKFEDNRIKIEKNLNDAVIAWLYEASGALQAQTKKNSRHLETRENNTKVDVKNSWKYEVDESKKEAAVGSPLEAAYWEEFGTGEHADTSINGGRKGREGWWVYVENGNKPAEVQRVRTERQAKAIAASMRKKGLDAYATNGIPANRPLFTAFTMKKARLIKRFASIIRDNIEP